MFSLRVGPLVRGSREYAVEGIRASACDRARDPRFVCPERRQTKHEKTGSRGRFRTAALLLYGTSDNRLSERGASDLLLSHERSHTTPPSSCYSIRSVDIQPPLRLVYSCTSLEHLARESAPPPPLQHGVTGSRAYEWSARKFQAIIDRFAQPPCEPRPSAAERNDMFTGK